MRAIPIALVVFAFLAFLLASCIAPPQQNAPNARQVQTPIAAQEQTPTVPLTATATSPSSSALVAPYIVSTHGAISFSKAQRTAACKEVPSPELDPSYFDSFGLPVLWTFQVNFDASSNDMDTGFPLGCLHLYVSDISNNSYTPIDEGGILIDTCDFKTTTGSAVFGTPFDVAQGIVMLDGDTYVVCEMNLREWISNLATNVGLPSEHVKLLNAFNSTPQDYPSLTMAAPVRDSYATLVDDAPVPLAYYEPTTSVTNTFDFELKMTNAPTAEHGITYALKDCPVPPTGSQCPVGNGDKGYVWWYDFHLDNYPMTPITTPTSVFQYAVTDALTEPGRHASSDIIKQMPLPFPFTLTPDGKLPFDVDHALFYIGYNPTLPSKSGFVGVFDSILIDPNDSKATNSNHG